MVQERPRSALLQQLLIAHDDRHSYLQRMQSPIGPGAYTIPSTFKSSCPNLLLRVVQRETYGRDFSRKNRAKTATNTEESASDAPNQLVLVLAADMHQSRRDQLRRMVQADRWSQDENAVSPFPAEHSRFAVIDSTASSPRAASSSDCTRPSLPSSSRGHWKWANVTDMAANFDKRVVEERSRGQRQQPCVVSAPLSYLMRTSYLERLQKHQRQTNAANQ